MIHGFEDKSKGDFMSRIDRDERYETLVVVVETTIRQRFLM